MIPGFRNAPILNDSERHQVGLTYKTEGQAAAVALGHRLVDPLIAGRVTHWLALAKEGKGDPVVICWRGGMRSELACEQLRLAGSSSQRVRGGYKAMRNELIATLHQERQVLVVAGLTGSGKTELVRSLSFVEAVDLEALAAHRGSSFGAFAGSPQPSQATFENALALHLRGVERPPVIEDESAMIGMVRIPQPLHDQMLSSSVVWLECGLDDRARRVHEEYLATPVAGGVDPRALGLRLGEGILRLRRRLGDELTRQIEAGVTFALARGKVDYEHHEPWIKALLTQYYDKTYQHAFERSKRAVVYRGSLEECRAWISNRYA